MKAISKLLSGTSLALLSFTLSAADIKKGAQLYDNWPKIKELKEKLATHQMYPVTSKKSGLDTWRCKECHGWDYIGKDGRYKSGSHFTGIKGVYDSREKGKDELIALLKNEKHDFSQYLSQEDLENLAEFIRSGLLDTTKTTTPSGAINGSPEEGKKLFSKVCTSCHGADGNDIDFKKDKPFVQGIGWAAKDNPQETLHKIRWGHPGTYMPSTIVDEKLTDQQTIDILSFVTGLE